VSRTNSFRAITASNASETGEIWLVCLTIRHPQIVPGGALYLVNDFADMQRHVMVNGVSTLVTFVGYPFQLILPDDDPDTASRVQLKVDNVDRQIVQAVRGLNGPPKADVEVVLATTPDTVEVGHYDLTMRAATFDALYVEAELTIEQIFVEPVALLMTPERFPGMF
jgi:hypothetical protein